MVRRPWRGYPGAHSQPADVFLLVEVVDSSLELDRGAKLELHARAGIREFWIADVTTNGVLVHRRPRSDRAPMAAARCLSGRLISQADAQIAAVTASRGATIATRHAADVEGCRIAVLDPWTD